MLHETKPWITFISMSSITTETVKHRISNMLILTLVKKQPVYTRTVKRWMQEAVEALQDWIVTTDQLKKQLERLNWLKAAGPDGITRRFLKTCANQPFPILKHLYHQSWEGPGAAEVNLPVSSHQEVNAIWPGETILYFSSAVILDEKLQVMGVRNSRHIKRCRKTAL